MTQGENLPLIRDQSLWARQDLFWSLCTSFIVRLVARGVKQRSLRRSFGKAAPIGMGLSAGDTVTVREAAPLRNRVSVRLRASTVCNGTTVTLIVDWGTT